MKLQNRLSSNFEELSANRTKYVLKIVPFALSTLCGQGNLSELIVLHNTHADSFRLITIFCC